MDNFVIKTLWTNKASSKDIKDFRYVVNSVFGPFCTEEYFKVKYVENIYGPSWLIIVYVEDKPVGANSLWRNDINGIRAYHSAETSVIKGANTAFVFVIMLKKMLEFCKQEKVMLYTFPNSNSFPGFKKMRWHVKIYYKKLFFPGISSSKKLYDIEPQYAQWWMKYRKNIFHMKCFGHYYLIKISNKKYRARILGYADKQTALLFPKYRKRILFLFRESETPSFYSKRFGVNPMVYTNVDEVSIPFMKVDAL